MHASIFTRDQWHCLHPPHTDRVRAGGLNYLNAGLDALEDVKDENVDMVNQLDNITKDLCNALGEPWRDHSDLRLQRISNNCSGDKMKSLIRASIIEIVGGGHLAATGTKQLLLIAKVGS